jgi:hypothetical protein
MAFEVTDKEWANYFFVDPLSEQETQISHDDPSEGSCLRVEMKGKAQGERTPFSK